MADDLVDMKRTGADENSGATALPVVDSGGQYPYGLQVRLEDEDLDKLGIEDLPAVGTEVKGTFTGVITGTQQDANDSANSSMTIQICCLQLAAEVEQAGEPKTAAAEAAENKSPGIYRSMGKPGAIVE